MSAISGRQRYLQDALSICFLRFGLLLLISLCRGTKKLFSNTHPRLIRHITDSQHDHARLPVLNRRSRKHRRRVPLSPLPRGPLFLQSCLAREGFFAHLEIIGLKERAVGGNQIARAEDEDVANDHVIHRHALSAFIAHNQHLRIMLCFAERAKLLLFVVVVGSGHSDDDEHRGEDREALKPLVALVL